MDVGVPEGDRVLTPEGRSQTVFFYNGPCHGLCFGDKEDQKKVGLGLVVYVRIKKYMRYMY